MTTETINQAMMPGMKTLLTVLTNAETQRTQSHAEKGTYDFLRVSPRPRRLCVKLPLSVWLLCVFALMPLSLRADTNDLAVALQNGLFEEEANRNLGAAISNYQSLATQFDRDRQIAATAIFRLGECYRKLGQTNDAVVQYQRIVREFSDQTTLITLSRQNLTGLGVTSQPRFQERLQAIIKKNPQDSIAPATSESAAKASELEAEVVLLKAQLAHLSGLKGGDRRIAVQQNFPNPVLTTLIQQLAEAEQKLASLTNEYALGAVPVVNATALVNTINQQIDAQVDGVVKGLQAKLEADLETAEILRAQAGSAPSAQAESPRTTDDEDREIRRIQQLIQNSPDLINALPSNNEFTPLGDAARQGQIKVATFLLDHGADINVAQRYGMTALHVAARAGNRAMVELLLSRGADVNAKDGADRTALHLALERNFPAVAETLLAAKADVNAGDKSGVTPLMLAVKNGNRKLATAMLVLGADPNLQNKILPGQPQGSGVQGSGDLYGTALHLAAARNNAAMVALLLTNHADVKVRNIADWTPLDVAASVGATEVAAQLIAAGAEVNAAGPVNSTGGATPLLRAAGNEHSETVKLLLEHGANPDTAYITGAGSTPLMLAAGQGNTEIAGLLVAHGARADLKDNEHTTALYRAVNSGKVKVVQLLLAHGANPNERNPQNYPLLIIATVGNNSDPDMAAAFLKAKADVNATDFSGQTALHYAARDGRKDLAEMLLTAGADPNLRSHDGQTPLDLAKRQPGSSGPDSTSMPAGISSASLADLLRQHGALDNLPHWDRIEVSRPSANYSATVFRKGTNDWNRFTLLETLLKFYPGKSPNSDSFSQTSLPLPDLSRLTIIRHKQNSTNETRIKVNLLNPTNDIDCSRDVPLEFGDVVEVPEREHALGDRPIGLTDSQHDDMVNCLKRSVQLVVHGGKVELSGYSNPYGSFIGFVLRRPQAQGVLLSSSDLSRVKVTRHDPLTGKKREWVLDCSGNNTPDLWLRNGDVIEVPEKP